MRKILLATAAAAALAFVAATPRPAHASWLSEWLHHYADRHAQVYVDPYGTAPAYQYAPDQVGPYGYYVPGYSYYSAPAYSYYADPAYNYAVPAYRYYYSPGYVPTYRYYAPYRSYYYHPDYDRWWRGNEWGEHVHHEQREARERMEHAQHERREHHDRD
jgi:hypothetical protein